MTGNHSEATVPSRNTGSFAGRHSMEIPQGLPMGGRKRNSMGGCIRPHPRRISAGKYSYSVRSSPRLKVVYFTPKAIDQTL